MSASLCALVAEAASPSPVLTVRRRSTGDGAAGPCERLRVLSRRRLLNEGVTFSRFEVCACGVDGVRLSPVAGLSASPRERARTVCCSVCEC